MSKFCLECQKAGPKDQKRLSKGKATLLTNAYIEKKLYIEIKYDKTKPAHFPILLLLVLGRGFW